jgi:AP endonuclease 1
MPTPRKRQSIETEKSSGTPSASLKRKRDSEVESEGPTSPQIPLRSRNTELTSNAPGPEARIKKKESLVNTTENSDSEAEPTTAAPGPTKSVQESAGSKTTDGGTVGGGTRANQKASRKKLKATTKTDDEEPASDDEKLKTPRRRKTKEKKEAEAMPLAARTTGLRMFVGAHVSMAKGVENAVTNAVQIGGNAFALFLKSQRKWDNPALKDENRDAFIKACADNKYDASSHVLPHGSYLVNLAQEEKDRAKQSYDAFLDDLHRCEALGIKYYNFHPGAAIKSSMPEAIGRLANQLNQALAETKTVVPVLENMAGSGTVIGAKFSDLRDVIAQIKPEFKSRIGVCLDTCHSFAAGYDLRTPESFRKVFQEFDDVVGLKYLKAIHLNDSKAPFNSNRDLHQNIGLGFLGLRAFHNVMNEPRLQNMPLILETPCDKPDPSDPKGKKVIEDKGIWTREIKLLESLIGMDPEGEEFKSIEKELSDKGKAERAKMQKQFEDKNEKAKKKLDKDRERGQRSLVDMIGKKKQKKSQSTIQSDEEEVSE